MTIGIIQIQERLIQAVGLVYQAATAPPLVSTSMEVVFVTGIVGIASGTGGLLQSPVPTRGNMDWPTTTAISTEAAAFGTAAFLLVASGIKT